MGERLAHCAGVLMALCLLALPVGGRAADAPPTVRVGVLQFGTVAWELDIIARKRLAERENIRIEVVQLAQKDAANVALQGGAVDLIATDWLWVARQRGEGKSYVFAPHSRAVGSILVRGDSPAHRLADLRGQRLGIAGGPVDKSWLLLRAYARKTVGEDAATLLRPDFVAPPLLNQLALRGELPAALNYWHYAARLKAVGWRELLGMPDLLAGLGIDAQLPLLGWVFDERWARANPAAIAGFLRASQAAKALLRDADAVWNEIRPLMKVADDASFIALRDGYRAGIPALDHDPARARNAERAAAQAFAILAREGGREVVGDASTLAAGVFWPDPEPR